MSHNLLKPIVEDGGEDSADTEEEQTGGEDKNHVLPPISTATSLIAANLKMNLEEKSVHAMASVISLVRSGTVVLPKIEMTPSTESTFSTSDRLDSRTSSITARLDSRTPSITASSSSSVSSSPIPRDRLPSIVTDKLTIAGKAGGHKFRTFARRIKTNLTFAKDFSEKHEDLRKNTFVVSSHGDGSESLSFDVNNFRTSSRTYGGLTRVARQILLKPSTDRTQGEILMLRDVVERLKCFEKYSKKVKYELARVLSYETFDDGRVIIKQGHTGLSFYFIVSGSVYVMLTEEDKKTGKKTSQILGELTEGMTFGELALLHNTKRTASIICKGDSEFLRLDKPDFDQVLRTGYHLEWRERLDALCWLPTFASWPIGDLRAINNSCKLVDFGVNKIVLGNTCQLNDNVYFVWSGQARVVRDLLVQREVHPGNKVRFRLLGRNLSNHELADRWRTRRDVQRRLLTTTVLGKGKYFGTGEDLRATYVVAQEKLECLVVPRLYFMRYGRSSVLDQMRQALDAALPSDTAVFERYIEDKTWDHYKQEVVTEVVSRRSIPNPTCVNDVPLAIREESTCNR